MKATHEENQEPEPESQTHESDGPTGVGSLAIRGASSGIHMLEVCANAAGRTYYSYYEYYLSGSDPP